MKISSESMTTILEAMADGDTPDEWWSLMRDGMDDPAVKAEIGTPPQADVAVALRDAGLITVESRKRTTPKTGSDTAEVTYETVITSLKP